MVQSTKCGRGDILKLVEMLLEWGTAVGRDNQKRKGALYAAAENGHVEIMEVLLEHCAGVDAGGAATVYVAVVGGILMSWNC